MTTEITNYIAHLKALNQLKNSSDLWLIATVLIAVITTVPVLAIIWLAFFPDENIWTHLIDTSLSYYFSNTIFLMIGVSAMVFMIGISSAYLVATYEFPLRRYFEWLLLLPLTFPSYVVAYLYTDLLEFVGPVQSTLRLLFSWELARDYWFPNIRSASGGVLVMGLVLYPYVYILARTSFLEQSNHLLAVSRLMGKSHMNTFFTVSLPIARPAIAIGIALALIETLNDFGTIDFFAIHTLTAGLYDVWLNMGNLGGAAQIASVMLSFVLFLITIEYLGRRKKRFYQHVGRFSKKEKVILNGIFKWIAVLVCLIPVLTGFFIPFAILLDYAITYFWQSWNSQFIEYVLNSLLVSFTATIVCSILAVVICYTKRIYFTRKVKTAVRLASMGYAVPGSVLAVGVVIPLAAFDNIIDHFFRQYFGFSTGLLFSGTVFILILTYVIRFLAISIGSVEASFSKISDSIDMASRTLGHPPFRTLWLYQLPLIKGGVLTAALIVFVDCMKELPATLLLRPFNFETLATHVYLFASDEMIELSALSALFIVLSGLIPVLVLSKTISSSQDLYTK